MWTSNGNVVDLGRIGVIATSYARAINSVRQVVGQSGSNSMDHAFLWTEGQGMQDLGTFGGLRSSAMRINDSGQVVGTADLGSGASHAFLWTEGAGMLDLGTLGDTSSRANGINSKGHVVGTSSAEAAGGGFGRAFVWTSGRGMTDLNSLIASDPNWTLVQGTAVNERGEIIATAFRGTSTRSRGVLLTPVMTTSLVSSEHQVKVGKPVTFTATVESLVQGPAPEGEIVTFKDGWRVLAQIPLTGGTASFTTSQLSVRTHSIRAYYSGDATYQSSKSAILEQVIEP
jgi:probable HAF family extracellular repeat protein